MTKTTSQSYYLAEGRLHSANTFRDATFCSVHYGTCLAQGGCDFARIQQNGEEIEVIEAKIAYILDYLKTGINYQVCTCEACVSLGSRTSVFRYIF